MPKNQPLRRIDLPAEQTVGAAVVTTEDAPAPPAAPTPPPPTGLTLEAGLSTADRSATAYINAYWIAPAAVAAHGYLIQYATDSLFTDPGGFRVDPPDDGAVPSAAITGLAPNTAYYVRVATRYYSQTSGWSAAATVTTPQDITPPDPVTGAAAAFTGLGDLVVTWANPANANFRDVEVKIYASNGGLLLATLYAADGVLVWTVAQNLAATSGTGDASLYITLRPRSWAGFFGDGVGVSATKSAPAAPTVSVDFTGADAIYTITPPADAARLLLTPDTALGQRNIGVVARYVYPFTQNRIDHGGTPDPTLAWSLVAVDGLNQSSAAASGTATNAAPAAPSAVVATAFPTAIYASVTATLPADFATYRYRLIQSSPSAADVTTDSTTGLVSYPLTTEATYQIGVKLVDVFGQASAETLSAALSVADVLTLADLRAGALYSDSQDTAAATLKAALADDNRASGGVSYASGATWQHFIRFERPYEEVYKTISLAMGPIGGATTWYLRTSTDGVAWNYYAGPVTSDGRTITAVASEAAARAAAIPITTLGGTTASRVDLPASTRARYVELWLRNTAASTRVDEFYPRRLVQSDDMETEAVKTLNLAAGAVTANKINVAQLSAITADMGNLTAGTITGATIRTAASGARVEMNSSGILGTNGTTTQWEVTNTDGKLKAGAGAVVLDSTGISIQANSAFGLAALNAYRFRNDSGATMGGVYGYYSTNPSINTNGVQLSADAVAGMGSFATVAASAPSTLPAQLRLMASDGSTFNVADTHLIDIRVNPVTGFDGITFQGDCLFQHGLNVGTASGAGAGQVVTSGHVAIRDSPSAAVALMVRGPGTTGDTASIRAMDSGGTANMLVYDSGAGYLRAASWTYGSDAAMKENIADSDRGLADVLKLRPRKFDYKGGQKHRYGFVAQEVRGVLPELVEETSEGLGIRTGEIIPLLVAAVCELAAEVRQLKAAPGGKRLGAGEAKP
jgi:hypothetical protein